MRKAPQHLRESGFQSTRPRGARRLTAQNGLLLLWFQSTRPRGARRDALDKYIKGNQVSIHAPARGATFGHWLTSFYTTGFNPRAREGRDIGKDLSRSLMSVSIHAPARGATCLSWVKQPAIHVSIHAPARGATLPGSRLSATEKVSIHAPARGATACRMALTSPDWFQSTRPRGARLRPSRNRLSGSLVSIHAPARGATTGPANQQPDIRVSIHAPARGATTISLMTGSGS